MSKTPMQEALIQRIFKSKEKIPRHPIIADLPEHEREPFLEWLAIAQRPINTDGSVGYYQFDYDQWKSRMSIME